MWSIAADRRHRRGSEVAEGRRTSSVTRVRGISWDNRGDGHDVSRTGSGVGSAFGEGGLRCAQQTGRPVAGLPFGGVAVAAQRQTGRRRSRFRPPASCPRTDRRRGEGRVDPDRRRRLGDHRQGRRASQWTRWSRPWRPSMPSSRTCEGRSPICRGSRRVMPCGSPTSASRVICQPLHPTSCSSTATTWVHQPQRSMRSSTGGTCTDASTMARWPRSRTAWHRPSRCATPLPTTSRTSMRGRWSSPPPSAAPSTG